MLDLEQLGFTKQELQERVIERLCQQALETYSLNEDGDENPWAADSQFSKRLTDSVREQIDKKITALAQAHVIPSVGELIEGMTLQSTNQWGEKTGAKLTFVEYLVSRAGAYMQEKVNSEGRSKEESGGYSWSGTQTRITHLINSYLHREIEKAMKGALAVAVGSVARGIHETARLKLNEIAASMKVSVTA